MHFFVSNIVIKSKLREGKFNCPNITVPKNVNLNCHKKDTDQYLHKQDYTLTSEFSKIGSIMTNPNPRLGQLCIN